MLEIRHWKSKSTGMKKLFYLFVFFVGLPFVAGAQRNTTFSVGFQAAQPIGEFGQIYNGTPIGVSGNLMRPLSAVMPMELGIGYSWNSMGTSSTDVSVFIGTDEAGDDIYENGRLHLNSNSNRFQMLGRLRPFNGMIQPYGDLVAGVETFRTKTTIDIVTNTTGYSSGNNAETQQFDATAYYGWAAGLRLRLNPHLLLDMRFENLIGGTATYVDNETVQLNSEDEILFETKTSKTDKYTYQIGLTLDF
jgi:hypothetical protein